VASISSSFYSFQGGGTVSETTSEVIRVEEVDGVAVATFTVEKIVDNEDQAKTLELKGIEVCTAETIKDPLFELTQIRQKIVLNFGGVDFLSSAALGALITLQKEMNAKDSQLRMCNIRPKIYEVFAITKLNRFFDIRDTRADALSSF